MKKLYIKSRLECPPPELRIQLKEKDQIIQKQKERIKKLESHLSKSRLERDNLFHVFNQLIMNLNSGLISKEASTGDDSGSYAASLNYLLSNLNQMGTPPITSSSSSAASSSSSLLAESKRADTSNQELLNSDKQSIASLSSPLEKTKDLKSYVADISFEKRLPNHRQLSSYKSTLSEPATLTSSTSFSSASTSNTSTSSLLMIPLLNQEMIVNNQYLQNFQEQLLNRLLVSAAWARQASQPNSAPDWIKAEEAIHDSSKNSKADQLAEINRSTDDKAASIQPQSSRGSLASLGALPTPSTSSSASEISSFSSSLSSLKHVSYDNDKNFLSIPESVLSSSLSTPLVKHANSKDMLTPQSSAFQFDMGDDFELAPDTNNQEIENLSLKYGGHLRTRRAARVIQLAYREYRLRKNYFKLCEQQNLKRLSLDIGGRKLMTGGSFDDQQESLKLSSRHSISTILPAGKSIGFAAQPNVFTSKTQEKSNTDEKPAAESTKTAFEKVRTANNSVQNEKQKMMTIPEISMTNIKSLASPMSSVSTSSLVLRTSSPSSSSTSPPVSVVKPTAVTNVIKESIQTPKVTNSFKRKQQGLNTPTTASASHLKSSNLIKDHDQCKRNYLVGLNLFNRKPEKGIQYLIDEKFLENDPRSIAEFVFNRNCLSKQMIGEYISNTQDKFIRSVLNEFIQLIDLKDMPVDEALRKFQSNFRLPGEAQKIEHLTHEFSSRYIECNKVECKNMFACAEDTIDVLAYAIILLNTSIHNPNVKSNEKMKFEQFLKMTKGIDNGMDIDKDYLQGVYERVKQNEFKPGKDHTTSVVEFEKNLVGPKKPTTPFSLPHRRLVCLVQLNEIYDLTKKDKPNQHQRDCFLFNDILVITKVFSKKKNHTLYSYRNGFPLNGLSVVLFVTNHYPYGIRLIRMTDKKVLITLSARNETDQKLFSKDLAEAIAESNEIESIRVGSGLEKQNKSAEIRDTTITVENSSSQASLASNASSQANSKSAASIVAVSDKPETTTIKEAVEIERFDPAQPATLLRASSKKPAPPSNNFMSVSRLFRGRHFRSEITATTFLKPDIPGTDKQGAAKLSK